MLDKYCIVLNKKIIKTKVAIYIFLFNPSFNNLDVITNKIIKNGYMVLINLAKL